jgi:hypothetical protein
MRGGHWLHDLGHYRLHENDGCFGRLVEGYGGAVGLTGADFEKINYLALFVGIERSKYKWYRKILGEFLMRFYAA